MIRFPYTLEIWDAAVNKWRVVGRCNVHYNGRAQFIKSQNGEVIQYTYEVIMPPNIEPIEEKKRFVSLTIEAGTYSITGMAVK